MALSDKPTTSTEFFGADFTNQLGAGETIVSAAVVISIVASSSNSGTALATTGAAAITGAIVLQLLQGGIAGYVYLVEVRATTSLGQVLTIANELKVYQPA